MNNLLLLVLVLAGFVLVAIGLLVWLIIRMRRLERHYKALTTGVAGGSLEAVLEDHVRQVQQATGRVQELDTTVMRVERQSRSHLQRVGFLRFNPFRDTGGDQSFVLALADDDGRGVVVSSLHSREVTRVYAKPLAGWSSPYQLTDEEQQAIRKAQTIE